MSYIPETYQLRWLSEVGAPVRRVNHTLVTHRQTIVAYGGRYILPAASAAQDGAASASHRETVQTQSDTLRRVGVVLAGDYVQGVHRYTVGKPHWEDIQEKNRLKAPSGVLNIPSLRGDHGAVVVGDLMCVFGGRKYQTMSDEVLLFDLTTGLWRRVPHEASCGPGPSCSHAMVADTKNERFFVLGGLRQRVDADRFLFSFDVRRHRWQAHPPPEDVDPATCHVAEMAFVPHADPTCGGQLFVLGLDEVMQAVPEASPRQLQPAGSATVPFGESSFDGNNSLTLSRTSVASRRSMRRSKHLSCGGGDGDDPLMGFSQRRSSSTGRRRTRFSIAAKGVMGAAAFSSASRQRRSLQHLHVFDTATERWSRILTTVSPTSPLAFRMDELRACFRYTGLLCAGSTHNAPANQWVFVVAPPPPSHPQHGTAALNAASDTSDPLGTSIHELPVAGARVAEATEQLRSGVAGGSIAAFLSHPYGIRSGANASPLAALPPLVVFSFSFETRAWSLAAAYDPVRSQVVDSAVDVAVSRQSQGGGKGRENGKDQKGDAMPTATATLAAVTTELPSNTQTDPAASPHLQSVAPSPPSASPRSASPAGSQRSRAAEKTAQQRITAQLRAQPVPPLCPRDESALRLPGMAGWLTRMSEADLAGGPSSGGPSSGHGKEVGAAALLRDASSLVAMRMDSTSSAPNGGSASTSRRSTTVHSPVATRSRGVSLAPNAPNHAPGTARAAVRMSPRAQQLTSQYYVGTPFSLGVGFSKLERKYRLAVVPLPATPTGAAASAPEGLLTDTHVVVGLGGCGDLTDRVFVELLPPANVAAGHVLPYRTVRLQEHYFSLVAAGAGLGIPGAAQTVVSNGGAGDGDERDAVVRRVSQRARPSVAAITNGLSQGSARGGGGGLSGTSRADFEERLEADLAAVFVAEQGESPAEEGPVHADGPRFWYRAVPPLPPDAPSSPAYFVSPSRGACPAEEPQPGRRPCESPAGGERTGGNLSSPRPTAEASSSQRAPFVPLLVPYAPTRDVIDAAGRTHGRKSAALTTRTGTDVMGSGAVAAGQSSRRCAFPGLEIATPQQLLSWAHARYTYEREWLGDTRHNTRAVIRTKRDEAKKVALVAAMTARGSSSRAGGGGTGGVDTTTLGGPQDRNRPANGTLFQPLFTVKELLERDR